MYKLIEREYCYCYCTWTKRERESIKREEQENLIQPRGDRHTTNIRESTSPSYLVPLSQHNKNQSNPPQKWQLDIKGRRKGEEGEVKEKMRKEMRKKTFIREGMEE